MVKRHRFLVTEKKLKIIDLSLSYVYVFLR